MDELATKIRPGAVFSLGVSDGLVYYVCTEVEYSPHTGVDTIFVGIRARVLYNTCIYGIGTRPAFRTGADAFWPTLFLESHNVEILSTE